MDTTKLIGGPCRVYIDVAAVETEVGHTFGGATLTIPAPAMYDLKADELGETPANSVYNGIGGYPTVQVALAEFTEENLARAIPNSVLVVDGTTPTKKRVDIIPVAGTTLLANAEKWTIKAIDPATGLPSTNKKDWVVIPLGAAIGAVELPYKNGEQRTINITIACLPDSSNSNRTLYFGDSTATP